MNGGKGHMRYRTLAWVMALICGLAIPAGAANLEGGFFDQPIFQPDAYEKLVSIKATTWGKVTRNIALKASGQDRGILATTTGRGYTDSIIAVDNALLVSVNGNDLVAEGLAAEKTFNKTTVASVKDNFNHFTGVANVNVAAGNLNVQKTYYSGPDLAAGGLMSNGGSSKLTAISK